MVSGFRFQVSGRLRAYLLLGIDPSLVYRISTPSPAEISTTFVPGCICVFGHTVKS